MPQPLPLPLKPKAPHPFQTLKDAMPVCGICIEDISGSAPTAISHSPTCACQYHTTCLLSNAHLTAHWQEVQCPTCYAILSVPDQSVHGESVTNQQAQADLEQLKENPAFRADIKALKLKKRARGVATKAYQAVVKTAKAGWKQQVAEQVAQLKEAQKGVIEGLRATDAHKEFNSKTRSYDISRSKFRTKYGLSRWQMREAVGGESWMTRFSHRRLRNLKWSFRIVI